jgi:hypothetical protein
MTTVDSLVAVDLRNWISRELSAEVTLGDILSAMPIQLLSLKVATLCSLIPKDVKAEQATEVTKEVEAWMATYAST